jgi:murein DD-endopeptidase MepM/ murein hydrolase activator NlpD
MVFLIPIFFVPVVLGGQTNKTADDNLEEESIQKNPNGFIWPLPGYTRISSPFGKRVSPTTGASSSHSGIDIPAPPGTKFVAEGYHSVESLEDGKKVYTVVKD